MTKYTYLIIMNRNNLRRFLESSLFEIVEESTMRIKCCLTGESAIEFIKGNITIFDSRGPPFNYKILEEECCVIHNQF